MLSIREKVAYLTEGGEEVEDIKVNYPRFEKKESTEKMKLACRDPPPIAPPEHKKEDVYENNMNVFETVDETAKEVGFREISALKYIVHTQAAKTEYHTFSSLVRVLIKYCTSELDKARAIFRLVISTKKKSCK